MNTEIKTQVAVLGGGPAGYSAAFRCAALGLKTVIIERYGALGGVCLNVGCIPSKALLHIAKIIEESKTLAELGIIFDTPKTNIDSIRAWKGKVIAQLSNGLSNIAKNYKIKVVKGSGSFATANTLIVRDESKETIIHFDYSIIAAGSHPMQLPLAPYNDLRIWNSTDALKLEKIPNRILIIGGGIIGLEIGTIYYSLGSEIDVLEIFDQIIPAADKDIINILVNSISKKVNLMVKTKITAIEAKEDGIYVSMNRNNADEKSCERKKRYDTLLVAIGRIPNSENISVDKIGIEIDDHGFIRVDKQMRTNIPHIFAVGDIVGQPMLAHKGAHEGRIAAEVISGMRHYFDPKAIPCVAYTDPEVAWIGFTEKEANKRGINYEISTFPWKASGRAVVSNCSNGMTKLIFNKETRRIIGGAAIGTNSSELLGEIGLAIEMGCDAEDIALTVHSHPTLYESIGLAAEVFEGSVTEIFNTRREKEGKLF